MNEQRPSWLPVTQVSINPPGVFVFIPLTPATNLSTFIDEETMNNLCKQWLATRKDLQHTMQLKAVNKAR